jgi:F-type H+-transporting ATPase subunit a
LPVILCSYENGFSFFSSSRFYDEHHNKISYNSYELDIDDKIISLDNEIFYDISITKNVVAILISIIILLFVFIKIANTYSSTVAPTGFHAFIDQVICSLRDEVAIPNIGSDYIRFMPYLLTVFFFI